MATVMALASRVRAARRSCAVLVVVSACSREAEAADPEPRESLLCGWGQLPKEKATISCERHRPLVLSREGKRPPKTGDRF
ncbi:MAG: hypothetical protein ACXVH3_31315 [Solirubrobacteraceae bacterium]